MPDGLISLGIPNKCIVHLSSALSVRVTLTLDASGEGDGGGARTAAAMLLPSDSVVVPDGGPALVVAGLDLRVAPLSRPLSQPPGAKAGRDPSIEAAASVETMCELQLLSGTLVLLLNKGSGRARPAHLYALEAPVDGPAPKHRTLYCSPLLLHNLQLHMACESAPLDWATAPTDGLLESSTVTVLIPRGACTEAAAALPRVASRVHVASVCVPAADPALSLGPPASGEARATAAALRRHFASTRFYSPGDLFVVPPRSWQALRTDAVARQGTGRAGRGAAAADEAQRRTAHESSASNDSDDDGAEHGAEQPRLFRVESIEHEEGGAVSAAAAGAARRGRGRGAWCWQAAAVREAVARRAAPEQPPERGLGSGLRSAVEVSPECGCVSIIRGQTTLMQACAWHVHDTCTALA